MIHTGRPASRYRRLPEPEDYRATIAQAVGETRHLIQEALGYIKRQEDGPLTMDAALQAIDQAVTDIQLEVSYLSGALERYRAVNAKALE